MLVRSTPLLLGLLGASATLPRGATAYFAGVNNAHVQFAATGEASGEAVAAAAASASSSEDVTVEDKEEEQPSSSSSLVHDIEEAVEEVVEEVVEDTVEDAVDKVKKAVEAELVEKFEAWAKKFGRKYESTEKKAERMLIWLENHAFIEAHNSKVPKPSFTLGHNDFSDLTNEDFQRRFRLGKFASAVERRKKGLKFASHVDDVKESSLRGATSAAIAAERDLAGTEWPWSRKKVPDYDEGDDFIDWTKKGVIGPIRNQGECGACWAFSAVGAIESAMAIKKLDSSKDPHFMTDGSKASLVSPLSEQNLIDCDVTYESGCEGGLMETAFAEEERVNGICSEADYPYITAQGTCAADMCTIVPCSKVQDYVDVQPQSSGALKAALKTNPVSIAIEAKGLLFQLYDSGIFEDETCTTTTPFIGDQECQMPYVGQKTCLPDVDHGVLVVGYGTDKDATSDTKDFFKIKNSWGDNWGEDGFIRIARHDDRDSNEDGNNWGECAMFTLLSYPIMAECSV